MELNPVDPSWESSENYLFLNPRLATDAQRHLLDLAERATQDFNLQSSILLTTSGSTVADSRFLKLVVHSKASFLANAKAVAQFLRLGPQDCWLQVLPQHHVGGLAIRARQHFSGCDVLTEPIWDLSSLKDLFGKNQITHLSVVPTQVFDLVKAAIEPPTSFKYLLVGGGFLSPELAASLRRLGWPVLFTYGMTETASMVSLSEDQTLRPLTNVELRIDAEQSLLIRCPSIANLIVSSDPTTGLVARSPRDEEGWFLTEDRAQLTAQGLVLQGRRSDFVKIGGEGTDLEFLRQIWEQVCRDLGLASQVGTSAALWAIPSGRLENEIQLLLEESCEISSHGLELLQQEFARRVLPNQRIRSMRRIPSIPRSELGKILWKRIGEDLVSN